MLNLHQVDCFCYSLWLVPIYWFRPSGCYGTKTATTRTGISKYHECSSTCTPALSHIGTISAFANSMELVTVDEMPNMFIAFANGKFNAEPVGLFYPGFFFCVIWNNGELNHPTKISLSFAPAKQDRYIAVEEEILSFMQKHNGHI